jgi:hypothetical protein
MKETNLLSILNAYRGLNEKSFRLYLDYHSIKIKDEELNDLELLVKDMNSHSVGINIFDKFYIGYEIPQIGKEFDLLRIDKNCVVNIELKKRSNLEKIKKQLQRNKYYLSFLEKKIHNYSYLSDERKIYILNDKQEIDEINISQLIDVLDNMSVEKIKNIDSCFNPSNYLISPFNSTHEFVKSMYFLTKHQEEFKKEIIKLIDIPQYSIVSIKGKAGTGKTLLTYDIAKDLIVYKNVLIVHCGILNNGHLILCDEYKWQITSVKEITKYDLSKYDLIIIDEAQRIYKDQLNYLIEEIKKNSNNYIFSYDGKQTLSRHEINNNIEKMIEEVITAPPFELTTKIRSNKEVASFFHCLLDQKRSIENIKYTNIELNYFNNINEAKQFLTHLKSENWKIINYTPSTYFTFPYEYHNSENETDNAHSVIGQEFDNVVAVIDKYFFYKNDRLSTRNYNNRPYYHPTKMLFQIVSRTRINLNVVIIDNQEVLNRCLEILKL